MCGVSIIYSLSKPHEINPRASVNGKGRGSVCSVADAAAAATLADAADADAAATPADVANAAATPADVADASPSFFNGWVFFNIFFFFKSSEGFRRFLSLRGSGLRR